MKRKELSERTCRRDESVTNDIRLVSDEYDCVESLVWTQLLQTRQCVAERRAIRYRVDDQVAVN